ncbi:hypothetical protein [Streptomyces sp. NPDC059452]|uniref:hypothetical protein n=1 Tax=Streptomyces sp. NPDC059452 TaxID=3346835 RepID=UPI0036B49837
MNSSQPVHRDAAGGPSPGNRTETVIGLSLLVTVVGRLLLLVADFRDDDSLAEIGRVLHWAGGVGIAATIVITRTVLRRWASGFDWIFAVMWIGVTFLASINGNL